MEDVVSCRMPIDGCDAEIYVMERMARRAREAGKVGWILLWLLGIPIPILFALFLMRGCT
jgi:hypothetical protein